ncbi:MAG: sulfatase [Deltaproteobacteria bacterium]|nr:sulfatase [Deltaproteobacteria bacterium]
MSKSLFDRRWPWLVAAGVVVLPLLSTILELRHEPDSDPRPAGSIEDVLAMRERDDLNVLFVVIDTLRADRLGTYGYERDTSPTLDRLASGGVRFAHHLAQSTWTKSSMASLWTGMYPKRTGVNRFDDIVPAQAHMPAEILKEAGFNTVALFRNGWLSDNFGFGQGFDVYMRPSTLPIPKSIRIENPTITARGTDEDILAAALEFLRVQGDERFFLYLHMMDVHEYVYDRESALFGGTYSDNYDNSIRWVDGVIDVLLAHLAHLGLRENTIIALASDHGEAFGERGLEGHARRLYRETTEVPFIISLPFRLEPGIVVAARTQNIDIWPTLLDLLGLDSPPDIDGHSRVSDILASGRGEAPTEVLGTAMAHLDQTWGQRGRDPMLSVAVTDGSLRYVRREAVPGGEVTEEVFDSRLDPDETRNRLDQDAEALLRLREAADSYLELTPEWGEAPTRELGELELNQLRALGYALP